MTAPPQIPADVQERAKAAAGLEIYRESKPGVSPFESGYLSCYTHERARIELAALEGMVNEVCRECREGLPNKPNTGHPRVVSYRESKDRGGELKTITLFDPCPAFPLHARIAQLRAEIEGKG
jgi:hypothetical protein